MLLLSGSHPRLSRYPRPDNGLSLHSIMDEPRVTSGDRCRTEGGVGWGGRAGAPGRGSPSLGGGGTRSADGGPAEMENVCRQVGRRRTAFGSLAANGLMGELCRPWLLCTGESAGPVPPPPHFTNP